MNAHLTMAISDYDHVRDLARGRVRAEGIDLTVLDLPVQDIFQRFVAHREWHVSEFSFALYISMKSRGDDSLVAIPVFPSRVFRHSAIYVRQDGPTTAQELAGASVGVAEWAQTAGVWARGILSSHYDVDLASIDWVQGGINEVGRHERVSLSLPHGISVRGESTVTLNDALIAGDLDAIITAHAPHSFFDTNPPVRRLFRDHRTEERKFFAETGVMPIMHLVVVRADVADKHPWVMRNLQEGFERALDNSIERLADVAISRIPLPWIPEQLEELEALNPNGRWWGYGIERNRAAIEMFARFAFEQGVADRLIPPEELFAPQASFESKI